MTRWWPAARASLVTLAIAIGLVDGCPFRAPGRTEVLAPFRPIAEVTHIGQRWSMFRGAPPNRYRMRIEARAGGGEWEVIYRAGEDRGPLWRRLAYRRVRGAWNPSGSRGPRGAYRSFASWVASEVFALDPSYTEVRVHMERIVLSGGRAHGTGEMVHEQVRRR